MSDNTSSNQETSHSLDNIKLPDIMTLKRLAISESGFIFDPETGHSFSVNETGMFILKALQNNQNPDQILESITDEYEVASRDAERELVDFIGQLRKQLKGIQS